MALLLVPNTAFLVDETVSLCGKSIPALGAAGEPWQWGAKLPGTANLGATNSRQKPFHHHHHHAQETRRCHVR